MALGGYKFAGYKVTKPEGATDAQWALLIHKARLKAFMAANTAASAGWEFDWSNGDESFETYGNVIYYADGEDSQNFVTFFKKDEGESTAKYYLIATLFNWEQWNGTTAGRVKISNGAVMPIYYSNSVGKYKVDGKTLFHTVGYSRFPENCLIYSSNNYPTDALPLIPIGGWTAASTAANSFTGSEKYKDANSLYLGCAIKDANVISFIIRTDVLTLSSRYLYAKNTIVGFDSLKLSSPNDSANIYGIVLNSSGSEIGTSQWNSGSYFSFAQETLKDNFTRYPLNDSSHSNTLSLTHVKYAFFNGAAQNYPFETVQLTTRAYRTSSPFLNSDGITSKGSFNIDLLSCNGAYSYTNFTNWSPVANGNYLTTLIYMSPTSDTAPQTTYYIGWDPSNPDITSEDAWTEYTE